MNDILPLTPAGQVTSEQRSILVRQAFTAIDTAATADEVKKVLEQWTGLAAYARKAKDKQLQADAAEIKMRAERRLGEMMQAQKKTAGFHKGGRPKTGLSTNPVSEPKPTLAEAGIDKNLANSARQEAAKSQEQFEEAVAEKKSDILEGKPKIVNPESPGKSGRSKQSRARSKSDKPTKTGHIDIIAAWINAPVSEQTLALDGIGPTPVLAAMPSACWPLIEKHVAERLTTRQAVVPEVAVDPALIPLDDSSLPPFLDRRSAPQAVEEKTPTEEEPPPTTANPIVPAPEPVMPPPPPPPKMKRSLTQSRDPVKVNWRNFNADDLENAIRGAQQYDDQQSLKQIDRMKKRLAKLRSTERAVENATGH